MITPKRAIAMALLISVSCSVFGCDEAKPAAGKPKAKAVKPAEKAEKTGKEAYKQPEVGKVMAKPEAAPAAKPAAPAAPAAEKAPAAAKVEGKVYGAGVSLPETVKVSDLMGRVDELAGKRVRVEGMVLDVCPRRGCWFEMASDKAGQQLRFKVRDGVMVFPMSAKGKYAVAEGVVRKIPLTLEQTKGVLAHEAAEYGKPYDASKVTDPITLVRLDGVGAVIRDSK